MAFLETSYLSHKRKEAEFFWVIAVWEILFFNEEDVDRRRSVLAGRNFSQGKNGR